jgi:glycosyltransferase involved in cell wall biosynthesis
MKILTHPVHTSWEYEFAKIGYDIYTVVPDDFQLLSNGWGASGETLVGGLIWNDRARPRPSNLTELSIKEALEGDFDICIVHTLGWLKKLYDVKCPIILKIHTMMSEPIEEWIERRVCAISFNNEIVMDCVVTRNPELKNVIRVPIDGVVFDGYVGDIPKALVVSHLIHERPEKRLDRLDRIIQKIDIALVGAGNHRPYSIGEAPSFDIMREYYRRYAVFLDVADAQPMSTLEAMATGMPIVTFPSEGRKQMLRNGENCIIVQTEDEAAAQLWRLLNDADLRRRIGNAARKMVTERYDAERFRRQWDVLLNRVK